MSGHATTETLSNLNGLAKQIHATAIDRGWWADSTSRDVGMVLALIHSEVSEALEEYRDGHALFETYHGIGGKPEGVPSELADVIIRVLDMCAAYMIDIDAAVTEKMAFNKTRPLRHGGKLA